MKKKHIEERVEHIRKDNLKLWQSLFEKEYADKLYYSGLDLDDLTKEEIKSLFMNMFLKERMRLKLEFDEDNRETKELFQNIKPFPKSNLKYLAYELANKLKSYAQS